MSKGFAATVVTIAAVALAAAVLWPSPGSAALDQWTASVAAELHAHDAYVARQQAADRHITHLETVAGALADSVNSLADAFDSLSGVADSLAARGDTGAALVVVRHAGAVCADALTLCRQRGDSLQAAVDTARVARQAAEDRAARADSLLKIGQQVTGCRVLFLRCPTRVQAFEAGGGLGALLALLFTLRR